MALLPVFLIAIVLTGVASNRSARILNRSETLNDLKLGAKNVSVVLATNVSACNSTSCGLPKVRRVRLKVARNFTNLARRRNDGFREPNRGLLPPFYSGRDTRDNSYQKPQQDAPTNGYSYDKPQHNPGYVYPKPQQDDSTSGYVYPKPTEDEPVNGYSYPKPKPQQDEPTSGYSYPKPEPQMDELTNGYSYPKPKPQPDDPSNGYSYPKPKPQQDEPTSGYSYPKPKPQQDEPSNGYSYPKPKPQQDEPTSGYSYPKPEPQMDELTNGYSYPKPKPQQDEPSNGYSYPKPKPQQDEPTSGYSYSKPKPQQDAPANGYSYPKPKPQQDEPSSTSGYSYPNPNPQDDEQNSGYYYPKPKPQEDTPSSGYSYPKPKPQLDESSNGYAYPKPQPQQDEPTSGESYRKPKPVFDESSNGHSYSNPKPQQTFANTLLDDYRKRYQPGSSNRHKGRNEAQSWVSSSSWDYSNQANINSWKPMFSHDMNRLSYQRATSGPPTRGEDPIEIPVPQKDTYQDTPETSLVPPNRDEPPWKLYGKTTDEGSLDSSYGVPQNDPLPSNPTYGPPAQPTRPPQNDPPDSYLPPQNDPLPPKPTYGPPARPTRPPQNDPADSYLPPQNDPLPSKPTYGPPARPTRPPQNDPADSYLPPQNDPLPPVPSYGPPARPTRPPLNDPPDSYIPPQNDQLPPKPTYGTPQDEPADYYLPPQNDPLAPIPTYGPPARPTRPPQNDPADSYLPPQNDPVAPVPSYGPPPRPTRPPQNDPIPQKPTYGPPARPTRPPPNDPADSYLPPQNDPVPPVPSYGPPARPTLPPQNDPADSYLPPQNDPLPQKPTYGPPARPTRPPQNDPDDSYLPPKNDPLPLNPTYGPPYAAYGPPSRPTRPVAEDPVNSYLPPGNNLKPPPQSYGVPQDTTTPPAVNDSPSTPYLPEIEDNRSRQHGPNGEYLSPPMIGAPSGSFDDPPSPVYVPYHFQEESDAGRQGNLPHDGNRVGQTRVLRVPGGLQPSDIHVTDLRCWRSAPSSVFAFTLWTTKKMAASPVLVSAESSPACRLRADSTAPRSRYAVRLAHTDLARCGVRPCTNNGEERMCVTLQLPQLTGIRLASDPQLEVSCAPPPQSDWSIKQLRMAAAAPPLGPPELRVKGGRSPLQTQLLLYRRSAPGGTWRRIESSQAVVLGEELQLRALVRGGDGWQSSKLGDVVIRRANSGEDLKSMAVLSDSTSAVSARLVTPEGCPNPDMEDVTGLQSWLAGDPLVSTLPIRVFLFRGQKDGEQIIISARVTACQDRLHCKMEPRQCEAANAATRVKRSNLGDEQRNNDTTSSEAEISLRVILPKSGLKAEHDVGKQPGSSSRSFSTTKLVLYILAPSVVAILMLLACFLHQTSPR